MSEPLMPRFAHIVRENPGAVRAATGARGLVGLNNAFIPQFTGRAQVV
jgi:hypothetical protein